MSAPGLPPLPGVHLASHQESIPLDLAQLEIALPAALAAVLAEPPGPETSLLAGLRDIEISILSDPEIARQHAVFLGDSSPTDVITFHHGEVLVSADTAARECQSRSWPVERELLLYMVHGLLHLHGYSDQEEPDFLHMHALQDRLLAHLWPE